MKQENHFLTPSVIALIMLSFLLGTSEFLVVGILQEISEGFQITITKAGSIVSVFAFAYAIGTPFFAALAGKYNRFKFTVLCISLFALCNLACGITSFYSVFIVFRVITAVVSGTLVSIAMTFAEDITSSENVPKVVAGIFSGFSIASVFGVPIATSITMVFGWRAAFFTIFATATVLLIILYRVLPQKSGLISHSIIEQFVLFREPKIIMGVLAVFLGSAGTYTIYTYLTPIFRILLHIPDSLISVALLVFGIAAIISNLASGKIAGTVGISIMPAVYLLQTLFLAGLPFTLMNLATGSVSIFILGVLMYLMNSPCQMLFLNTAAEKYPSCINLAASLNSVFFNLGIAAGSISGGFIVETAGMRYAGLGGAALAAAAGICCMKLVRISCQSKISAKKLYRKNL